MAEVTEEEKQEIESMIEDLISRAKKASQELSLIHI